jgi:hypothetical protein
MHRFWRIYYNAIVGGAAGLVGWLVFGFLVEPSWPWLAGMLAAGAIIGGIIGYVVVGWEYLVDGSAMRFLRTGTQGCLLGALGGALGLVLGELINYALQMGAWLSPLVIGVLARGLGWMVFGLTIGLAEGWVARSLLKTSYGAVGGSLGGFFGGAVFAALLIGSQRQEWTYVWGQASALVILGASIGSLIASVEEALKPASVKILRGWREGREFSILKRETTLGRDERADILLLRDMKVEKWHARIVVRDGRYFLVNTGGAPQYTLVNGRPVAGECELLDGHRIQLGDVLLLFQQRSQAVPARAEQNRAASPATPPTIPEAILLPDKTGK